MSANSSSRLTLKIKSQIQDCVCRIQDAHFDIHIVKSMYTDLRQFADYKSVTKQIGHFIGHGDGRDRGPFVDKTDIEFVLPLIEMMSGHPTELKPTLLYRQSDIIGDLRGQLKALGIVLDDSTFALQSNLVMHYVLQILSSTPVIYAPARNVLDARIGEIDEFNGHESVYILIHVDLPPQGGQPAKDVYISYAIVESDIPWAS